MKLWPLALLLTLVLAGPASSREGDDFPDFSYAGYRAGEVQIPTPPVRSNLRLDFGARGDGVADDTAALQRAVDRAPSGALLIPSGTYRITAPIHISRPDLVLRGEGEGRTVLLFPRSLTEACGNKRDHQGYSQWSFGPGFLIFEGKDPIDASTRIARVIRPANRGERILETDTSVRTAPGEWLRITASDPPKGSPAAGSLLKDMLGGLLEPGANLVGRRNIVRFLSRVKSVHGRQLELERPLPVDLRPEWTSEVHRFTPTVHDVGIEDLSVSFPATRYPGHFKEAGYNGVSLHGTANSWIRNVTVKNADFALELDGTNFCTVDHVRLTASPARSNEEYVYGHHGIFVGNGSENLIEHFDIEERFVHDVSFEWFALHTVVTEGRGRDLNLDFHRESPYECLACDLDLGIGTRPFDSGGSLDRGPHTAAHTVFWNLRSLIPLKSPGPTPEQVALADLTGYSKTLPPHGLDFGPLLTFVGVPLAHPELTDEQRYLQWRVLKDAPEPNLYRAELRRRLRATSHR